MVVTHNPCNPQLKQWVAELQRDMVSSNDSNDRTRKVLEPPLIAERNCKSLKNHDLMPTRLPAPLDAVTGNFKCDRSKCLILQQLLVKTEISQVREQARCSQSDTGWLDIPPTSCTFSIATLAATPNTSGKQTNKQTKKPKTNKQKTQTNKQKTKQKQENHSEDQVLPTPVQYQHKHRHSCHQTFQLTEPHIANMKYVLQ